MFRREMVHQIGVIPGDGIGPQVVDAALTVLRAAGVEFDERRFDIGADRYARDQHVLDDADVAGIRACDAILKGPLGPPIGDTVRQLPRQGGRPWSTDRRGSGSPTRSTGCCLAGSCPAG